MKIETLKLTTQTLLNGQPITELSPERLYDMIAQAEASIESMLALKNRPASLLKSAEDLAADIKALVRYMDGGAT